MEITDINSFHRAGDIGGDAAGDPNVLQNMDDIDALQHGHGGYPLLLGRLQGHILGAAALYLQKQSHSQDNRQKEHRLDQKVAVEFLLEQHGGKKGKHHAYRRVNQQIHEGAGHIGQKIFILGNGADVIGGRR